MPPVPAPTPLAGCVPPFTRGILGHEIGLVLGRAFGHPSRLTSDRYPIRYLAQGKSVVTKGIGWQLQCRCSLSRLSRRCTRTPLWARPSKTARRLSHSICDNAILTRVRGDLNALLGKEAYHVDIHDLSTFHNPIKYRFILAQGSYLDAQNQRLYFTPEIKGVSTAQHMSHSIIRLACYLAVVCGVSLRHIALIFALLFLISITKSSIKRWIDDIGSHLPSQEEMLRQLLARGFLPRSVILTATTHWAWTTV